MQNIAQQTPLDEAVKRLEKYIVTLNTVFTEGAVVFSNDDKKALIADMGTVLDALAKAREG